MDVHDAPLHREAASRERRTYGRAGRRRDLDYLGPLTKRVLAKFVKESEQGPRLAGQVGKEGETGVRGDAQAGRGHHLVAVLGNPGFVAWIDKQIGLVQTALPVRIEAKSSQRLGVGRSRRT